jgi:SpoVK/Ycf46/Vps4 family AAA+-type ATPase
LDDIVPYDLGGTGSFIDRIKTIIDKDSFSLLLYGPPGVSKTVTAQAIAKHKGWELIYITPSDFICGGESAIEQKAKLVFDTLLKMSNVVVFFDEIDRLLLDRDSEGYGKQGDIFQFMTPSMLAKFTELRKIKKLGFIIATNYAERIDRAIKREGRIDKALLCVPPNKAARKTLLRGFIESKDKPWTREDDKLLDKAARQTAGYVYEELQSMASKAVSSTTPPSHTGILKSLSEGSFKRPEVTPDSYKKRIESQHYPQKPLDEYTALRVLAAEAGIVKQAEIVSEVGKWCSEENNLQSNVDLISLVESCKLDQVEAVLRTRMDP